MYTNERSKVALEILRNKLHVGDTIFSIVRSVSRSGLSRRISFFAASGNPTELIKIDSYMGALGIGSYRVDRDGLRLNGCGMDMCFDGVYQLGRALWPDGFTTADGSRNAEGGYALRSEVL